MNWIAHTLRTVLEIALEDKLETLENRALISYMDHFEFFQT